VHRSLGTLKTMNHLRTASLMGVVAALACGDADVPSGRGTAATPPEPTVRAIPTAAGRVAAPRTKRGRHLDA
jgi:hypothetical protein